MFETGIYFTHLVPHWKIKLEWEPLWQLSLAWLSLSWRRLDLWPFFPLFQNISFPRISVTEIMDMCYKESQVYPGCLSIIWLWWTQQLLSHCMNYQLGKSTQEESRGGVCCIWPTNMHTTNMDKSSGSRATQQSKLWTNTEELINSYNPGWKSRSCSC